MQGREQNAPDQRELRKEDMIPLQPGRASWRKWHFNFWVLLDPPFL